VQLALLDQARSKGLHRPKPQTKWPKGSRQPLSKELAERFVDLVSSCDTSIAILLEQNPDLPNFKTLETWKHRHPWFARLWYIARQRQAEFLIQKCIEEARTVTGKTAHSVRVKFDIYRFVASKFYSDVYGDKSQHNQQQSTTVNVGVSIAPERLSELRNKLDNTRASFSAVRSVKNDDSSVISGDTPDVRKTSMLVRKT
jgi:hypothetical protein